MKAKIFPAPEAALILREALGPLRAWDDCLSDMRRGTTKLNGFTLLPVCQTHDGRAWRPGYAGSDIADFIRSVLEATEDAKPRVPPQFKELTIDRSMHWRVQKLEARA